MKLKDLRKTAVAVLGAALTIGLNLGLTGKAADILTAVAAIATAAGVYGVRNGDKPAVVPHVDAAG